MKMMEACWANRMWGDLVRGHWHQACSGGLEVSEELKLEEIIQDKKTQVKTLHKMFVFKYILFLKMCQKYDDIPEFDELKPGKEGLPTPGSRTGGIPCRFG